MIPRKLAIAAAASIAILATASYFSPHWTVYRMRTAIEKRDYKAFSAHADFLALRESFKRQLGAQDATQRENARKAGNALERLGRELAGLVAGPMIDTLIGPAAVMEMLNAGVPAINRKVITSAMTQVPAAGEAMPGMNIDYRDWNRVAFRDAGVMETDGSFILIRSGWWSWKLAEVELPPRS